MYVLIDMYSLCVVFLRFSASVFEHVLKLSFTLLQGICLSNLAVASPWHSTTPVTLRSAASTTTTSGGFRAHSDDTLFIVVHYFKGSPHSPIHVVIRPYGILKEPFIQTAVL